MTELTTIKCSVCGAPLKKTSEGYRCRHCDSRFTEIVAKKEDDLLAVLDKEKQEYIANRRQLLWEAITEKYLSGEKIIGICREIRLYLPNDFMARFFEAANDENPLVVNDYLSSVDKDDIMPYRYIVADWFVRTAQAAQIAAANGFVESYFMDDELKRNEYLSSLRDIEKRLNEGEYNPYVSRDVFLAYAPQDVETAEEIVKSLESKGLSCYAEYRNFRPGFRAKERRDEELRIAFSNCRYFVFVCTENSKEISGAFLPSSAQECFSKPSFCYVAYEPKWTSVQIRMFERFFGQKNLWAYSKDSLLETIGRLKSNDLFEENLKKDFTVARTAIGLEIKGVKDDTVEEINIPYGVASIAGCAFKDCKQLRKVTFSESVTNIGKHAFEGCVNLTRIDFGNGITQIDNYAFTRCEKLIELTLPKTLTYLGDGVFANCDSLEKVTIESSFKEIRKNTFFKCSNLKEVFISDSVDSIENDAFFHCENLPKIVLPQSLEKIGDSAFGYCNSLTNMVIPASVKIIEDSAFNGCVSLNTVYCRANKKPSGWNDYWLGNRDGEVKVVWGYDGETL